MHLRSAKNKHILIILRVQMIQLYLTIKPFHSINPKLLFPVYKCWPCSLIRCIDFIKHPIIVKVPKLSLRLSFQKIQDKFLPLDLLQNVQNQQKVAGCPGKKIINQSTGFAISNFYISNNIVEGKEISIELCEKDNMLKLKTICCPCCRCYDGLESDDPKVW